MQLYGNIEHKREGYPTLLYRLVPQEATQRGHDHNYLHKKTLNLGLHNSCTYLT